VDEKYLLMTFFGFLVAGLYLGKASRRLSVQPCKVNTEVTIFPHSSTAATV
jgi:hypothetical protein